MSLFFNTQRRNAGEFYHETDMDKVATNMLHQERDDFDPLRITGKGTGVHPVPVYKYESVAYPELQSVRRNADIRHQQLEDRRHASFNRSNMGFFIDAPLQ